MIDLSRNEEGRNKNEDLPVGGIILVMLPVIAAGLMLLEAML